MSDDKYRNFWDRVFSGWPPKFRKKASLSIRAETRRQVVDFPRAARPSGLSTSEDELTSLVSVVPRSTYYSTRSTYYTATAGSAYSTATPGSAYYTATPGSAYYTATPGSAYYSATSGSTYSHVHELPGSNSGVGSKDQRETMRLQVDSEYHKLLQSKALLPLDPMVEQDWSGRGQHAEFQREERKTLNEILEVYDTLGSTSTAIVQSVRCRRILLARKTIHCSRRFTKEEAIEEVAHLNRLAHSHIVRAIGTYVMGNELSILLYPVAEYNLETFLQECETNILARSALFQFPHCLVDGVAYIHSEFTKHMDIKPKNILVKGTLKSDPGAFKVYIADFGIARYYENLDATETEGPTMFTRKYAAPEVVDRDKRGLPADIFSLGCVFLEIFASQTLEVRFEPLPEATELSSEQLKVWEEFQTNNRLVSSRLNLLKDILAANEMGDGSYQANLKALNIFFRRCHKSNTSIEPYILHMLAEDPKRRPTAAFLAENLPPRNCCVRVSDPLEAF